MSSSDSINGSILKIEVDDISNHFISFFNLALKKLLPDYFCLINSDNLGQVKFNLNSFNIKLINSNNTLENIFEDKLFLIKVHFLKSEKDMTKDFFNNVKNSFEFKNMSLILISTEEIKKDANIQKECIKYLNKIKSKTSLNDIFYLPYSITDLDKIKVCFKDFLNAFANKFSKEFLAKINSLSEKLENFINFEIIDDTQNKRKDSQPKNKRKYSEADYKYVENCIYYLDLISKIKGWKMILPFTEKLIFKEFQFFQYKLNTKMKPEDFFDYDENKIKMSYLNKKLSNVDFNEYLMHYYIISCHNLKKYENIINIVKLIPKKMELYSKYFKTEYHYFFWNINYLYLFIDYLTKLIEKKSITEVDDVIVFLYNLCIKYYKIYICKNRKNIYYFPNKKMLNILINNINNSSNIKDEIEKLFIFGQNEVADDNFKLFINDIDDNNKKNDKIFILLNDNKKLLNEILGLYKSINSENIKLTKIDISIRHIFEEIYILISLFQFEEVKNILVSLLNQKYLKKKKFNYIYEYACLILLLVLNYLNKDKENINIILKLLKINFVNPLTNKLLRNIECEKTNIIYEIISNYLESYIGNNEEKEEINLILDNIIDINFYSGENKILFINKSNNNSMEKMKYEITNKTGLEININKILILFEEINSDDDLKEEKNIISYEIKQDKNTFKKIEPFINKREEFIEIELNEIFKTNHIYRPIEIHYLLKNSIKAKYKIKENIEFIISEININIKAELLTNNYYYNILSFIKITISNINESLELNKRYMKIELYNINNQGDSIMKIQTELAKNELNKIFQELIISDNSIEFPPGSIKNIKDLNTLEIPFFIENNNYYDAKKENKIKLVIYIKQSKESKDNIFAYNTIITPEFSHLFNLGKRFKKINNKDAYLMQTFLTLNSENTTVTVYNNDDSLITIDSKQAINKILVLSDNENEIIKKLRNNYIKFSLEGKKDIIYQFCYPEKNILEEIREMKEIPYHITINVENNNNLPEIYNEMCVNINIKKYKNKKSKLMISIKENEQWSIIGRNKIIEEFNEEKFEKNIKLILLPLLDGFLNLPEFEFSEYCESDNSNEKKYEPIEYGSIIEGEKKAIKIAPLNDYSLKINLT